MLLVPFCGGRHEQPTADEVDVLANLTVIHNALLRRTEQASRANHNKGRTGRVLLKSEYNLPTTILLFCIAVCSATVLVVITSRITNKALNLLL